jgi:ADP-ribose pyrophosphatase
MITKREIVFRTPWLTVEAKHVPSDTEPFYSLKIPDYVVIVAYTRAGELLVINQYRPAVEANVLELPSGLMDSNERPEEVARRELAEETAYHAGELIHLGTLFPDTGKLGNRMWCYLAPDADPIVGRVPESGIETVLLRPAEVDKAIADGTFIHALPLAALALAALRRTSRLT